jgi:ParB-like chromosome segregation protein Spo0J
MAAPRITTTTQSVSINSLVPHPSNPRRGNIDAIVESLRAHGQYRPIVANLRTNHILAGTHTWKAAKRIGWTRIAVSFVDVSDEEEKRILLVDNRASDLASYDDALLSALLRSLDDLSGAGYSTADLDALEGLWNEPASLSSGPEPDPDLGAADAEIIAGSIRMSIERDPFDAWAIQIEQNPLKPEENLRRRLDLPARPKPPRVDPESTPVKLSTISAEKVPIDSLILYPGNARQGDIGAIAESLSVNGQFRPIVVNRPSMEILVGNHTYQAARALGWTEIAVTFVEVDEQEARRIVLVDNRTTDIATYDSDALVDLLRSVSHDLAGTGFSGDDIDDLLAGASGKPQKAISGDIRVRVERWTLKIPPHAFEEWIDNLGSNPEQEIADRLDLPVGSWRTEKQ